MRKLPRVGPVGPTTLAPRPVNVNVTDAPARVDVRTVPPLAPLLLTVDQPRPYFAAEIPSWYNAARTDVSAAALTFPARSTANTMSRYVLPKTIVDATARLTGLIVVPSDLTPSGPTRRSTYRPMPVRSSVAATQRVTRSVVLVPSRDPGRSENRSGATATGGRASLARNELASLHVAVSPAVSARGRPL